MKYILGKKVHEDGSISYKHSMSFSSYKLAKQKTLDGYCRRYFENEPSFSSVETDYGKKEHKRREELTDKALAHCEKYETFTLPSGLELVAYIDYREIGNNKIKDYKTGQKAWTQKRVDQDQQLTFYCMLCELKYGSYHPNPEIHYIETINRKPTTVVYEGREYTDDSKEITSTGVEQVFIKTVTDNDIKALLSDVQKTAEVIHTYCLTRYKLSPFKE